jgi:hypothetical protein
MGKPTLPHLNIHRPNPRNSALAPVYAGSWTDIHMFIANEIILELLFSN